MSGIPATVLGHYCAECGAPIRVGEYVRRYGTRVCDDCVPDGALAECALCGQIGVLERVRDHGCEVSR